MILGSSRIELFIPDAGSLKAKRGVLKGLKERIRNRYNVSVAEVGHSDLWQRSALGVAVVSNETKHANSVLSAVVRFIERDPRVELTDYDIEMM